jgi:alkanesulfonate monooxygenase SsuD/methylene tetrahydromethanopterin reductase-like flavin-dependent oxidoreductase (luciferase family)
MRFAIGVPNVGPFADPHLLCALGEEAEAHGWDGFFLWDHLFYRHGWPVTDPWIALAAVAARTRRIRLALLVAALPRQHPGEVAKRSVSLDHLSGGRLTLGAGLGSLPVEYEAFGQSADAVERGERLDEHLDVVHALWSGAPVRSVGRHHRVDAPAMGPRPLQEPRIPVWVGGRWPHPRPFRRAARWDGVVPTHVDFGKGETMPPDEVSAMLRFVAAHRDRPGHFDVALEGSTPGADVRAYADAGVTWWIEALGWWRGTLDDARRRVRAGAPSL